jgi:uncharacterized RDD family membrane protein YckC
METAIHPATHSTSPRALAATAAPPLAADTEYVGIVTRGLGFVIDAAIVDAVALIVAGSTALILSVLPGSGRLHGAEIVIAAVAFGVWCIAYWTTFWTTTGQTPGDRVMHIRVTAADGSRLHVPRALIRLAGIVAAAIPFFAGFVPIMLTQRRRGLQDWLANTVVTRELPAPSAGGADAAPRQPPRPA